MHIDRPVAVHLSKAEAGLLLDLLRRHGVHPASASAFAALNEALERLAPIPGIVSFFGPPGQKRRQHPVIDHPVTARFSKAEAGLLLHLLRSHGGDPATATAFTVLNEAREAAKQPVSPKRLWVLGVLLLCTGILVGFRSPLFWLLLILVFPVFMLAIWNRYEV